MNPAAAENDIGRPQLFARAAGSGIGGGRIGTDHAIAFEHQAFDVPIGDQAQIRALAHVGR